MKQVPLISKSDKTLKKQNVTNVEKKLEDEGKIEIVVRHCYDIGEKADRFLRWFVNKMIVLILILVFVVCGAGIAL